MTSENDKTGRAALGRLVQSMVEDILDTPDDEILAEYRAEGGDVGKLVSQMRVRLEAEKLKARKGRLAAARAGLAASRAPLPRPSLGSTQDARVRLAQALAACSPSARLTLAARNESELSDADVLGMLEDLAELGIDVPDDEQGRK